MLIKMTIYSILLIMIMSCNSNQGNKNNIQNELKVKIPIDSIGYIVVEKADKNYSIQSKDSIKCIIDKINSSDIEYIKFGSPNKFTIYNTNGKVILKAFFRDYYFKSGGIVYKAKSNLFD